MQPFYFNSIYPLNDLLFTTYILNFNESTGFA